ncbi:methyltransferase [Scytonema sp. NUACC26]|uniref:methyltransferase n=1 Tax=Scytonema sp. NUACC26 TaxID=3140176 RepID=UPI0034DC7F2B
MSIATVDSQPNPLMQILQMMNGFWMTQCIGVAAQLGVADRLIEGAKSVETLAESMNVDAQSLYRLLRALASVGIFLESEPRQFQLTPMADYLRSDVPNSIQGLAIWSGGEPTHWQMWGNLLYSVRTGKPAFEQVTGMPFFAYTGQNPEFAAIFDQAMTSASAIFNPAIVHAYDFSSINTLVDIGGGQGTFLAAILQANPHLNGIVYDLPQVTEGAKSYMEKLGLQNRCQAIGGNFLESVPEGGDAYILKNTLTNWDDKHAIQILQNCYCVMPQGAKLLMVQSVIEPGNQSNLGKFTDLEMLLVTSGGRERSATEFEQVLNAVGLQLARIIPTQCPSSLIEAIKP